MKYDLSLYSGLTMTEFFLEFGLSNAKRNLLLTEGLINNINFNSEYLIKKNDVLIISYTENDKLAPNGLPFDILYEDDYFLIVDKLAGIKCHPNDNENDTLLNMIKNYYLESKIDLKVKYIHRLDIETSGLFIIVKDILTESYMNKYYISDFKREYLALVSGNLKNDMGIIDIGIARDRHQNRMTWSKKGQMAKTEYEILKRYGNYTLVKLKLETGRTHQIRVHMRYLGHPLLGDVLYGGSDKLIKRVALHSYCFTFIHPYTRKEIKIKCRLPLDMKRIVGDNFEE